MTKSSLLRKILGRSAAAPQLISTFQSRERLSVVLAALPQADSGGDVAVLGYCAFLLDFLIWVLFVCFFLLSLFYMASFTNPIPRCCGCTFSRGSGFYSWVEDIDTEQVLTYSKEVNRLLLQTALEYPKFGVLLFSCREVQLVITYTL